MAESFRCPENPKGISMKEMEKIYRMIFQVNSWPSVVVQCGVMPNLKSARTYLTAEEFKLAGGKSIDDYWIYRISSYLIKGLNLGQIDSEIPELTYKQIKWKILSHPEWNSVRDERHKLIIPRLALAYQLYSQYKDYADKIAEKCSFIKGDNTAARRDNIEHWTKTVFTISVTQARLFFKNNRLATAEDFLKEYYY